jgi:hypothetical protein
MFPILNKKRQEEIALNDRVIKALYPKDASCWVCNKQVREETLRIKHIKCTWYKVCSICFVKY